MPDAATTIRTTITTLLARREASVPELLPETRLSEDLGLDSLELVELSVTLEDVFGRDPWSGGLLPVTVGEVVAFYGT